MLTYLHITNKWKLNVYIVKWGYMSPQTFQHTKAKILVLQWKDLLFHYKNTVSQLVF